jgi:hypothetical protein
MVVFDPVAASFLIIDLIMTMMRRTSTDIDGQHNAKVSLERHRRHPRRWHL